MFSLPLSHSVLSSGPRLQSSPDDAKSHILFNEHHSLISCPTSLSELKKRTEAKMGMGTQVPHTDSAHCPHCSRLFSQNPKEIPLYVSLSFPIPLSCLSSVSSHHLGGRIVIGFIPFQNEGGVTYEWVQGHSLLKDIIIYGNLQSLFSFLVYVLFSICTVFCPSPVSWTQPKNGQVVRFGLSSEGGGDPDWLLGQTVYLNLALLELCTGCWTKLKIRFFFFFFRAQLFLFIASSVDISPRALTEEG